MWATKEVNSVTMVKIAKGSNRAGTVNSSRSTGVFRNSVFTPAMPITPAVTEGTR